MKEDLHLFEGEARRAGRKEGKGMKRVLFLSMCVIIPWFAARGGPLWGWTAGCGEPGCAEVRRVAPDGVNKITLEVDGRGYVQGESMTTAYVPERYIPQSGDEVCIGDFPYIMVRKGDWERLTNAVGRLEAVAGRRYARDVQTPDGRALWHGDCTNRFYTADGRHEVWQYADGYSWSRSAAPGRRVSPSVKRQTDPARPVTAAPAGLPPRLAAKKRALQGRPAAKEVNATFGPGGKVMKVEEVK